MNKLCIAWWHLIKKISPRSFISPEAALDKGLKLSTASTGTELDHNDHRMKHNTIIYDTTWYDMIWDEIMSDMTNMTWKMNQQDWQRKIFYSQQQISDCMWFEYILTSDFQEKQIYIDVFLSTNISKLRISAMSLCLCQPDVWGLTVVFCIGEQLAERPMAVGVCGVWYRTQWNLALLRHFTSIHLHLWHERPQGWRFVGPVEMFEAKVARPPKCAKSRWRRQQRVGYGVASLL